MPAQSKTANNSEIDLNITTNGNNEITGAILNAILKNLVASYEDFIGSYNNADMLAIAAPTLRMIVFNTTQNAYYYWDGTRWVQFGKPKYRVYTALITQSGTGAPTATVLENTFDETPVWTRDAQGIFHLTFVTTINTTKVFHTATYGQQPGADQELFVDYPGSNVVRLTQGIAGVFADDLTGVAFEFRLYY